MLDVLTLIDALKHPAQCFPSRLASLRAGKVQRFDDGRLALHAGGFGYTARFDTGEGKQVALKFFKKSIDLRRATRYRIINGYLAQKHPAWYIPVSYQHRAVRVGRESIDCLVMPWREGTDLVTYITEIRCARHRLVSLAAEMWWLFVEMQTRRVALRDMWPGNIRVNKAGHVFLLDYDTLFVPGLERLAPSEPGMLAYQCPSRPTEAFGPEASTFASWLVYGTVLALLIDPHLWLVARPNGSEDLLFTAADFTFDQPSLALNALSSHPSRDARSLSVMLKRALRGVAYDRIPSVTLLPCPTSPSSISSWLASWSRHLASQI